MGLQEIALTLTLSLAAWTDWREHRIYNVLLGPALFLALAIHIVQGGWVGLSASLWGTTIGFGLLLLPYLLGGMGAGDVKLLAVIGAFGGARFVLTGFLYGAIIGGIFSAALLARRHVLVATFKRYLLLLPFLSNLSILGEDMRAARQEKFPYGIALCLGTFLAFFLPLRGL
ncbi:MAG: A24 family peptidase [Desulfitobacteriaceae bacterium]